MANSPPWSEFLGDRPTKRGEASENAENADLISGLPDELLINILSFVPTITSVTTSVLSKRWSRLWISVPNIDFCDFSTECLVRQAQFENFIDRFFTMNRIMSVRTVKFHVEEKTEMSRVNAWIAAISERDAGQVGLSFPAPSLFEYESDPSFDESDEFNLYSMPDKFFIQNNLVKLELSFVVLKVPQLVCFPNLKKMKLISIQNFDDNSLKNLLSGSPVIGNLYIKLNEGRASHTLYICSSSLRNLRLEMMAPEAPMAPDDYKIVIDTPNLEDLSLSDQCCITYNIINLSSLVSAHLCKIHEKAFLELLTHISHVKELVLNDISMIGGFHFFDYTSMPIFNDLIHLGMKFQWTQNSKPLFHLFKCTPNLVTLSLTLTKSCFHNLGRAWSEPHEVPQCFLSSIESVDIKWVGDSDQEMPMISYILKNAMVLKNLSLHYNCYYAEDLAKENKFLLTLLTLPRSSPIATCQVTSTRR